MQDKDFENLAKFLSQFPTLLLTRDEASAAQVEEDVLLWCASSLAGAGDYRVRQRLCRLMSFLIAAHDGAPLQCGGDLAKALLAGVCDSAGGVREAALTALGCNLPALIEYERVRRCRPGCRVVRREASALHAKRYSRRYVCCKRCWHAAEP